MSKLIALDAGHGRYTAGKRCLKSIDPNETREWWLNDRITRYVTEGLARYDCSVMRTDDPTGATDVPLSTRCARANNAGAAILISIHHNAGINGGSGGGICVFAATVGSATSKKLQKAVYEHTVNQTGLKGNRSDPLPLKNFYMVYNTNMPAILGEFGFMDSTTDVPMILTDEFARRCAKGIVDATVEVLSLKPLSAPDNIDGDKGAEGIRDNGEPSEWAKEACQKAVESGLFIGNGNGDYMWQENLTREMMAVLLDRLGLINNKTEE